MISRFKLCLQILKEKVLTSKENGFSTGYIGLIKKISQLKHSEVTQPFKNNSKLSMKQVESRSDGPYNLKIAEIIKLCNSFKPKYGSLQELLKNFCRNKNTQQLLDKLLQAASSRHVIIPALSIMIKELIAAKREGFSNNPAKTCTDILLDPTNISPKLSILMTLIYPLLVATRKQLKSKGVKNTFTPVQYRIPRSIVTSLSTINRQPAIPNGSAKTIAIKIPYATALMCYVLANNLNLLARGGVLKDPSVTSASKIIKLDDCSISPRTKRLLQRKCEIDNYIWKHIRNG